MLPSNMLGLTDEQIEELKLVDEWGEKCVPNGDWKPNKDPLSRRNGRQPNERMRELFMKAVEEARAVTSKVSLVNTVLVYSPV